MGSPKAVPSTLVLFCMNDRLFNCICDLVVGKRPHGYGALGAIARHCLANLTRLSDDCNSAIGPKTLYWLRTMHEITSRFVAQFHLIFDRFSITKSAT